MEQCGRGDDQDGAGLGFAGGSRGQQAVERIRAELVHEDGASWASPPRQCAGGPAPAGGPAAS
jgi:hypothetical protein